MWGNLLENLGNFGSLSPVPLGGAFGGILNRVFRGGKKEVPASKPVPPTTSDAMPIAKSGGLPNLDPLGGSRPRHAASTPDFLPASLPKVDTSELRGASGMGSPALEPAASRPRYTDPIQNARSEFVAKRAEGGKLRNILSGILSGVASSPDSNWGSIIGGAAGGGLWGALDPQGQATSDFNRYRLPELEREQLRKWEIAKREQDKQKQEADIAYRQHQEQADREKSRREQEKWDYEKRRPIKTDRGMMRPDETIIEGTAPLPTPRPPVSMGGIDYKWNPKTGDYEPNVVGGNPTQSTNVIIADKNIAGRKAVADQTDERQRAIAAMNEGGRRTRHESGSSKPGQSGALYQKWATMRKKALNEDGALSQEEVNAAVVQMNEAAEQLRNDPSFEVSGEGGWSWVKPRQGGQAQGGNEIDQQAFERIVKERFGGDRAKALEAAKQKGITIR